MTAEVVIMNQTALVMAADSATTVTMQMRGERRTRYFKGANKLFQLSAHHPVGMMIYGSANLNNVSWELLLKDFRAHLGTDPCAHLSGYSQRLVEFIEHHTRLYPSAAREQLFLQQVAKTALTVARDVTAPEQCEITGQATREEAIQAALESLLARLRATPPQPPICASEVEEAIATHAEAASTLIADQHMRFGLPRRHLAPVLAEVGIRELMAHYGNHLPETGVVIGGYGYNDYYPAIEAFRCYGFLNQQLICNPRRTLTRVSSHSPAAIIPFAISDMINTFRLGFGPDILERVTAATESELRDFAGRIQQVLAPNHAIPNLESLIQEAVERHSSQWCNSTISDHFGRLAAVISVLPVTEMAALAKGMIELESLKERVTEPTESVAGPIDVAVISKHDGFVWIERKHYFEAELNPRFSFVNRPARKQEDTADEHSTY